MKNVEFIKKEIESIKPSASKFNLTDSYGNLFFSCNDAVEYHGENAFSQLIINNVQQRLDKSTMKYTIDTKRTYDQLMSNVNSELLCILRNVSSVKRVRQTKLYNQLYDLIRRNCNDCIELNNSVLSIYSYWMNTRYNKRDATETKKYNAIMLMLLTQLIKKYLK